MDKKRILVIDDDERFQVLIKVFLQADNAYDLLILSEAKDILSCVKSFKPDVILLDLLMPEVGGIEVCEMLNGDPLGSSIPIIIVSSLDKDADRLCAFKQGVVSFLVKPSSKDEMNKAIQKALSYKENK